MGNETVFTPPVTLRRYYLPNVKGEGWGVVVIGSDGFFSAVSDYGNYAYWWPNAGIEFRLALLKFDWHYIAKKLANGEAGRWNEEKSLVKAKECIAAARECGEITEDEASDETERVESLDWNDEIDFVDWARDTPLEFEVACECRIQEEFPVQVEAFAKILIPRLKDALRAEMAAEAAPHGKQEAVSNGA